MKEKSNPRGLHRGQEVRVVAPGYWAHNMVGIIKVDPVVGMSIKVQIVGHGIFPAYATEVRET